MNVHGEARIIDGLSLYFCISETFVQYVCIIVPF